MPRLAWFTPLPPSRSGIAAYSAELIPLLSGAYTLDTFIDPAAPAPGANLGVPSYRSTDFIVRHQADPYDLIVYHLGNATCHDYMWPYLVRFPGLVVLHDAQLHQARAKRLLTLGRPDDYRAEFAFCHPDANQGIAELVIAALGGSLYFLWPLNRVPIDCARLVAVHTAELASQLHETFPSQEFRVISMGVSDPTMACRGPAPMPPSQAESPARQPRWGASMGVADPLSTADVRSGFSRIVQDDAASVRARHAIPADRVVFAAYGMLTPEKRLTEIFKGLRTILPWVPNAHLLLVGERVDYYDVEADARSIGVADRVTITGYVADEELPAYLAAADVCLCLRWPTSHETSASWLRCLAAGKPTVINDLVHMSNVPALDPRTWSPTMPQARAESDNGFITGAGGRERAGAPNAAAALGWRGAPLARRPVSRDKCFSGRARVGLFADRTRTANEGYETDFDDRRPICVTIDIVDEQHSLGLAMRRLARDEALRRELGYRARQYWAAHHTLERMAADYRAAIDAALERPAPDRSHLPAHLRADGTELTSRILGDFGLSLGALGWAERI